MFLLKWVKRCTEDAPYLPWIDASKGDSGCNNEEKNIGLFFGCCTKGSGRTWFAFFRSDNLNLSCSKSSSRFEPFLGQEIITAGKIPGSTLDMKPAGATLVCWKIPLKNEVQGPLSTRGRACTSQD